MWDIIESDDIWGCVSQIFNSHGKAQIPQPMCPHSVSYYLYSFNGLFCKNVGTSHGAKLTALISLHISEKLLVEGE